MRRSSYDGVVTTDGTGGGSQGVGGTEDGTAGLNDVLTLPDHGADGAAEHVGDETLEEGLGGEILVVLLEVLLAGGGELHGNELEAAVLEARDDGANESTLILWLVYCFQLSCRFIFRDGIGFGGYYIHTWTPSGLMAMKLEQFVSLTGRGGVAAGIE
jgi:hypothetical protein